jgi:hypothetical protein
MVDERPIFSREAIMKWLNGVPWRLFDVFIRIVFVTACLIVGLIYALTAISMIWALYWILSGRNIFNDEETLLMSFVTDTMDDVQGWQRIWKCHIQEM